MLFNSWEFILFFAVVYGLYWSAFKSSLRAQNILLLIAGYLFYSFWNWRFLALLMASTVLDYVSGRLIFRSQKRKKVFLWLSTAGNLGILGFFKYYNFFAGTAAGFLSLFHLRIDPWLLNIVLPVGISFYTFHGMSYVFDIYYGKVKPTNNIISYAVFVSFFPLLVAGPIERATQLLPQVEGKRVFNHQQSVQGLRLILWGYFLKVVVADSLAKCVNPIFNHYQYYNGATLALAAMYFAIQIYGDFCGYTSIARGIAKLLGFELVPNFRFPYLSRNIAEFWRRWHISLSSWFRDYVYIPLGGSRISSAITVRNIVVVFLLSGLWHGASWNFVAWGAIHALLFIATLKLQGHPSNPGILAKHATLPALKEFIQVVITFVLVCFAWIFFRSPGLSSATGYIRHMAQGLFTLPAYATYLPYAIVPLLFDWLHQRSGQDVLHHKNRHIRRALYFALGFCILLHSSESTNSFIYFQF